MAGKRKTLLISLFLVLCLMIVFGISETACKASTADGNDMRAVVAGNTDFAFALYGKLKDDPNATIPKGEPNGNLFFSPYSLSTALAMTYAGARGNTEKQMATALHFTLPRRNLYSAFGTLQKQLIQEEKSRGYQLLLANALWLQKGEPFLKEFLDLNKYYYGAGLNQLDFNETEKSRQIINLWVEEKTKEKIKELIPPGGVDEATVLVLTNAIYFKGEWRTKFEKKDTERADFAISAKDKVKIDLMHLKEDFKYYEDEKMQAVELPYKGNELSMLVLLPEETEGLKKVEDTLTAESINVLLSKMKATKKVDVYFPKFKIVWGTFSLNEALIALGMRDAFDMDKGADFSGINGKGDIWIKDVFHKAVIEINEEGTEAAAATAVVMEKAAIRYIEFRADHPFIFIIKDNRSGSILFMGKVINPLQSE
jgi:serpin B